LAAGLAAAASGADVLVLEGARFVGGTSAMSGGVVWLPAHGKGAPGSNDSAERALTYLCALTRGDTDVALMRAFVSDAARVAEEIEKRTPLEWEVLEHWPDYRGELPGASSGGRSMWPRPLRLPAEVEGRIQTAPDQPSPAGAEVGAAAPANDGVVLRGHVRGRALCGGLLAGVLDAAVEVRTDARVHALVTDAGGVTGVTVNGQRHEGRVVLASGGFQHDAFLVGRFLQGPVVAPMGAGGCVGDGLRMAMAVGADVANMSEGWWMPAMRVPGETVDGVTHYRPLHSERAKPGAIMVDRHGRRFADEAQNYGDVGQAMRHGRAGPAMRRGGGPHPSVVSAGATGSWWLVFDDAYRRRYPVGPLDPSSSGSAQPDPDWLLRADDLAGLARRAGIPPESLVSTVARFNAGAATGEDGEFGRGSYPYDRWIGDAAASHPTLAPLSAPPFYAVEVHLGCMGTKGGPRTDDRGRVLTDDGQPVPGLYAAGNVAASPFGAATPAGGATLGPALVFGYRAGEAAATDP
jgi:succinate dehydrogenase/fumarate reductase flavoprotein subunit